MFSTSTLFTLALSALSTTGPGAMAAAIGDPHHAGSKHTQAVKPCANSTLSANSTTTTPTDVATSEQPHQQDLSKRFSNTRWTFYDVGQGACGKTNVASDFVVALNAEQFGSGYPGPNCFKSIELSYGGKTATATVADKCPECPYGGLDLSRGLFDHFASQDLGIVYGEWNFVDGSGGGTAPPITTTKVGQSTTKGQATPSTTPVAPAPTASRNSTAASQTSNKAPTNAAPSNKAPTNAASRTSNKAPNTAASQASNKVPTNAAPSNKAPTTSTRTTATLSSNATIATEKPDISTSATAVPSSAFGFAANSTIGSNSTLSANSTSSTVPPSGGTLSSSPSSPSSIASSPTALPSASSSTTVSTTEQMQENIKMISSLLAKLGELIASDSMEKQQN